MRVFCTLFLLWRLELRGRVRWLLKQVRRPAGAIMLVFWCLMMAMWIVQVLFAFSAPGMSDSIATSLGIIRDVVAIIMALVALLALMVPGDMSSLLFRPVETDILFAGPFARRQILAYKLASSAFSSVAFAIMVSIFASRIVASWLTSFAAAFLVLHFIRVFPLAYTMLLKTIEQRGARTRWRIGLPISRTLAIAIRVGIGVAIILAVHGFFIRIGGDFETNAVEALKSLRHDPLVTTLSWPFQAYGNLFVSDRLVPDALYWLAIAGSINLALVASIILLDADFMESELAGAQRRYARLEQMRRGQFFAPKAKQWGRIRSLPDFPRLRGAGPVAWRQTTGSLRSFPTTMLLLPILSLATGFGIQVAGLGEAGNAGVAAITGIALYITLLYSVIVQRSFRGDLDFMETLKAMPAQPAAIVLGESFAPIVQFTYIHLSISLAVVVGFERPMFLLSVLILAPPLNCVLALAQNLGFLLLPARVTYGQSGDIVAAGKQMICLLIVGAIFMACLAAGLVVGAIAWALIGHSPWAAQLGAALGLWISVAVLVPIAAAAFKNFDFSADMPG
ncbi:MAG: putative ABC exporter domain-containing protein [Candidatus Hydrogenedentales bacterium]|jgi:hypothetical protein